MILQAKQRLMAFKLNKIKMSSPETLLELKSTLAEFEDDLRNPEFFHKHYKKLKSVGTIDYYTFVSTSGHTMVVAVAAGSIVVGFIRTYPYNATTVASVYVHPKHQGKKIGVSLYEHLFQKLGKLRSSDSLSVGSSAMWAQLCKKHNGVFVVEEHRLKPVNYVKDRDGGTYPVLMVDDKPVSLKKLTDARRPSAFGWAALEGYYEIKK